VKPLTLGRSSGRMGQPGHDTLPAMYALELNSYLNIYRFGAEDRRLTNKSTVDRATAACVLGVFSPAGSVGEVVDGHAVAVAEGGE
jgi:hypothetical protein